MGVGMKKLAGSALVLSVLVLAARAVSPPVSIGEALAIAEKSMKDRGLEQRVYIQSISLERTSLLNSKPFWLVRWSTPLPASEPKTREIGIKVDMEGRAVRLVKGP